MKPNYSLPIIILLLGIGVIVISNLTSNENDENCNNKRIQNYTAALKMIGVLLVFGSIGVLSYHYSGKMSRSKFSF